MFYLCWFKHNDIILILYDVIQNLKIQQVGFYTNRKRKYILYIILHKYYINLKYYIYIYIYIYILYYINIIYILHINII